MDATVLENGGAVAQTGNNKFQGAVSAWKSIDLTHLMPSLDSTASEIVDHQRDSLVQRKELAQKTKDFRKLDDDSKLNEFKALLKAYQSFVDVLTTHSKSSSSGFLKVYSLLSEAPDPYPLLEASIESLLASEETVPYLSKENKDLKDKVAKLTSQLEENEQKLSHEASARKTAEEGIDAKVKEVEASWAAVLAEKRDNWEAKERSLEEQVENQERLLKEIKASYEVTQRLDRSNDDDGPRNGAIAAELEMVSGDLDRTRTRLADIESRNEQLRTELAKSASQAQHSSVEDSPAFIRLQSESSSLLRKLDNSRTERETQKHEFNSRSKTLERQMASLKTDRDMLQDKLKGWSDYDEVKRELDMLRSIEFATAGDVDDDEGSDTEKAVPRSNGAASESLEQLLLARNKKLSDDLTILRVSHKDLQSQISALTASTSSLQDDLTTARTLNSTLENDLLKLQQTPLAAPSIAGTYTSRHPTSTAYSTRRGRTSPTSSLISGFEPPSETLSTPSAGILPMITAQRDRFKARNAALETELSTTTNTITSLRSEISSLQKDNLSLYEKTRYVSTFNRSTGSSYTPTLSIGGGSGGATSSAADDRYRSAYESQMSPFAAFRGRESARALKRMLLPERVWATVMRLVLKTRTSRNLFAGYCLLLHGLVFLMLFGGGGTGPVVAGTVGPPLGNAAAGWEKDPWDAEE
ncbi:MAG: hypothetical protein M1814_006471 [Vezdaea aestivalis]|nr:MAG: hypothetical protein M1814_006471 [Vezdaea aestivalis]